jgi:hypothetical protein
MQKILRRAIASILCLTLLFPSPAHAAGWFGPTASFDLIGSGGSTSIQDAGSFSCRKPTLFDDRTFGDLAFNERKLLIDWAGTIYYPHVVNLSKVSKVDLIFKSDTGNQDRITATTGIKNRYSGNISNPSGNPMRDPARQYSKLKINRAQLLGTVNHTQFGKLFFAQSSEFPTPYGIPAGASGVEVYCDVQ